MKHPQIKFGKHLSVLFKRIELTNKKPCHEIWQKQIIKKKQPANIPLKSSAEQKNLITRHIQNIHKKKKQFETTED